MNFRGVGARENSSKTHRRCWRAGGRFWTLALLIAVVSLPSSALAAGPSRSLSSSFGVFGAANPRALTVDQSSGDVYVVNTTNSAVERFTSAGVPDNFTAGPDAGTNALTGFGFSAVFGTGEIAVDNSGGPADGRVYITDTENQVVKVFSSSGEPLATLAGTEDAKGSFNAPCGVAVDQASGELYVADRFPLEGVSRVWRYTPSGATVAETDYSGGIDPGFEGCQLAADSGHVYLTQLAGGAGGKLVRFRASDFKAGVPPAPTGVEIDTGAPATVKAVAVEPLSGDVYADHGGDIAVYHSGAAAAGAPVYSFGAGDFGATSVGVAVARGGNAYVADRRNTGGKRVVVYGPQIPAPSRSLSSSFGVFGAANPRALTVDQSSGDVYVVNTTNSAVERFTSAGVPDNFTAGPDAGTNALTGFGFSAVFGTGEIAVDNSGGPADGRVYITDTENQVVKVFSSSGEPLATLAGTEDAKGSFNAPCGVAVDQASGELYVADRFPLEGVSRVWRYTPSGATVAETDYSGGIDPGFEGCQLAADSGHVYLTQLAGGAGGKLVRFRASDFKAGVPPAPTGVEIDTGAPATVKAVAVEPLSGDVYADHGGDIAVYHSGAAAAGAPVYSFGAGDFGATSVGVAVARGGNAYVADRRNTGGKRVVVYGPEIYGKLLTVVRAGSGTGTISGGSASEPSAIDCGTTCTAAFPENAVVTLTAAPADGSSVVADGWTGCESVSVDGTECTLTINANTTVTATFLARHLTVAKEGAGSGTVTATPNTGPDADAAIDCGVTCAANFVDGTIVTLTATATADSHFAGWSGCDTATGNECTLTMSADRSVTAIFFKPSLEVAKAPSGSGSVASFPAGIDCGATCESLFDYGSTVTLTPTPDAGSAFKEWAFASSGTGEGCDAIVQTDKCEVTLSADREVDAVFATAPRVTEESVRPHDTSARFEGAIDPESEVTEYSFEYVTEDHYQAENFVGAESVPVPVGSLPAGDEPAPVTATATGLVPSTSYRFRLVAVNPLGEDQGDPLAFSTFASGPLFETCPNQEFRNGILAPASKPSAGLPDCRAYEQASPVKKNGGSLQGSIPLVKAAVGGDGVTFESGAGIPNGDGAQEFPIYMASRSGSGWSTNGLLPPASTGETAQVLGWTPDFELAFDKVRPTAAGPQALLARPRGGNPVEEVVPYTDPGPGYAITGFSADNSEVVFAAQGVLPVKSGDPAPAVGEPNLYTWDRGSDQFSLVGVLPDGSVPVEGSSPIGGYAAEKRAVSSDGSVFFAAGSPAQIYLRQHPTEPETAATDGAGNCVLDPVLACTIAVSASQAPTPDPGGPLAPTFRGAAADGSSAFFTSPEELTETAHTSAQTAIARADLDGTGVLPGFAPHADASAVAVDAEHIYWVDPAAGEPGEGKIGRADIDGSNVDPDFITGADNPQGVVVFAGHIYWTNAGHNETDAVNFPYNLEGGSIGRATLNGQAAASQVEQNFITGASYPVGIDAGPGYLYWANRGPDVRAVSRATLDGTTEIKFDWFEEFPKTDTFDVAVDSAHDQLYLANGEGLNLVRANLTDPGVGATYLAATGARQIAVDGSHLYWPHVIIDSGPKVHSIARANLNGEEAADIINADSARGIAVDGSHVYWGSHPAPSTRGTDLYRYQVGSGELTDLTPDKANLLGAEVQGVLGAAADGSYIYFAANGLLAPGASLGNCHGSSGSCSLYLWHEDPDTHSTSIALVTRLNGSDAANWAASYKFGSEKAARVSRDGRTLLFSSTGKVTAYENEGENELYRYRVGDPVPTCVSCNPTAASPAGPATLGSIEPGFKGSEIQMELVSRNLSGDGNRVFFETRDALVAADTNGDEGCPGWGSGGQATHIKTCQDVYEWEASGTGSCKSTAQNGGCLYLLSSGKGFEPAFFADADEEGDNVFIFTTAQLVGQDGDRLFDVYDARVGGGLASQNQPPPVPCESEEACRGVSLAAPLTGSPATPNFSGPGNPPVKRCPKGKLRRHGKCVKKHARHHGKHARHNRDANTTRRAGK